MVEWGRKIFLHLGLEPTIEVLLFPAQGETPPRMVYSVSTLLKKYCLLL